jgi:uncharacterized membrane protein YphA (DoxX/SURF4 family)
MQHSIEKMSAFCFRPALGLLLVRLATGYVFLMHGYAKVTNLAMVTGMMTHFGLPAWLGIFVAWLEVIGGVALILGIATRAFAVALGIEMVVAIFLTGFSRGFSPHEFEMVLALNSFALALAGSGKYRLLKLFERD